MPGKNRFKKAVETATENTKESIRENISENTIENIRDNTVKNIVENTSENTKDNATEKALPKIGGNILSKVLEGSKKNKGGNHTLYLSADVGAALTKCAKQTKRSKSTLVDEILREVLINRQ